MTRTAAPAAAQQFGRRLEMIHDDVEYRKDLCSAAVELALIVSVAFLRTGWSLGLMQDQCITPAVTY